MKKIKLTYIISDIYKAVAFEWLCEYLNPDLFDISFILLNPGDSALEESIRNKGFKITRITYKNKKSLIKAFFIISKYLYKNNIDVIHTNLFDANLAGLLAGYIMGVKKRIYSRHHSAFHHTYYPHAVKYDKLINYIATDIIAVSNLVKKILIEKENVKEEKIHMIHHGFNFKEFENVNNERVETIKRRNNYINKYPIIGIISRYFHLKGLQYAIPAFKKILNQFPNAHLVLANAAGDYKNQVHKCLAELPKDSYSEILYEEDFIALYKSFDLFVHVPVNGHCEAFGQIYVEALAAEVPSVFTLSGIASEFIQHEKNALVVDYENSDGIFKAIQRLLIDPELRTRIKIQGKEDVLKLFPLNKMVSSFENVYLGKNE